MERELITLLQSIEKIRDAWIKEKDPLTKEELHKRLINLYSILGANCDNYLKKLEAV